MQGILQLHHPLNTQWMSLSPGLGSLYTMIGTPLSEEWCMELLRLIKECANHVAASNMPNANIMLEQISRLASANGSPIQRIAAYFIEAFAEKMLKKKIACSLQCHQFDKNIISL